jgi:DNA replication and repair protein RecF
VLEALFVAGRGQSFRHREVRPWIREGEKRAFVFVRSTAADEVEHRIGFEQARGGRRVRVDGREMRRRSELARALPLQLITPNSHELVERGPGVRRRFLDWGLFHVEHQYHELAVGYRRVLEQRNAALKAGDRHFGIWDTQLAQFGEALTAHRSRYVPELEGLAQRELDALGQNYRLAIRLHPGWPGDSHGGNLVDALGRRATEDFRRGFTSVGAHRASVDLLVDGQPAERRLSRGQQKLLVYGLFLAMARLGEQKGGEAPVLLIDDLPAELDRQHRQLVVGRLGAHGLQVWITAVEWGEELQDFPTKMFHVEHGTVSSQAENQ